MLISNQIQSIMARALKILLVIAAVTTAQAQQPATPNSLTKEEIAKGWILLFDGETTFGWTSEEGDIQVQDGALTLRGKDKAATMSPTSRFNSFELTADYELRGATPLGKLTLRGEGSSSGAGLLRGQESKLHLIVIDNAAAAGTSSFGSSEAATGRASVMLSVHVHDGSRRGFCPQLVFETGSPTAELLLRNVKLRPLVDSERLDLPAGANSEQLQIAGLKPIFNGKDLDGWKEIPDRTSKFSVNESGELTIKDGPGDIQTEGQWDNFVLQLEVKTNGQHLNSGVFFRTLPGEFWSGYESQIRNEWQGDDRTKPVDFGTGAIYNRQPARKVVSDDNEWFTKTIVAYENHLAVWVNGYQVSDFTDERPANNNARQGVKLGKGPISLQGHDPTTDLNFRNIRIIAMPTSDR